MPSAMPEAAPARPSDGAPSDAAHRPPVRPLGVELVLPTLEAAGMETMVADLAEQLAARGHRVGVTCLQALGPLEARLARHGVRTSLVPTPGFVPNLVGSAALAAHLRAARPDVVHVHSGSWGKAAWSAARAGLPGTVFTIHGLLDVEPWHSVMLKRWAMRRTAVAVAVSEPLARHLRDEVRIPADRVELIINGIDAARFAPGPRDGALRARLGLPADRPLVGTVARLVPVKHQALLVEAFARLVAAGTAADLVIVGEGELRGALEAQARALGVADRVHLPGATDDTAPVYRALDAFVLCSLAEGTSISVLEAMASGTPVVATAVGGTPALLDAGACGALVPSGDAGALAAAIADALASPAARERAARARARAVAHYGAAAMAAGYERVYARVGAALPSRRS